MHSPTSLPTRQPTSQPTGQPYLAPTSSPSGEPTAQPTSVPSSAPSSLPSCIPSIQPSSQPTGIPTTQPSAFPSVQPSAEPTGEPTGQPTYEPTSPTSQPTSDPTFSPSAQPTRSPTGQPSGQPSSQPTRQPMAHPTSLPSAQPSMSPSAQPSGQPSISPTAQPSGKPTGQPSNQPSALPTTQPTSNPTSPTSQPSSSPTILEKQNLMLLDMLSLDHYKGILINGRSAYDNSGFSVSYAGDINKDGYDDIMIGAPQSSPLSRSAAGSVYIVYGSYGNNIPDIVDIEQGNYPSRKIYGAEAGDQCGIVVSKAGDVNKDGYADYLISCYLASPDLQINAGKVYLIYGSKNQENIDLLNLKPSEGILIKSVNSYDKLGYSVSSAGDVNNDGYDDIIISSPQASPLSRTNAGTVYIVYGNKTIQDISLSSSSSEMLNSVRMIYGSSAGDFIGDDVSGGYDINQDGFADVIIGAASASDNNKIGSGVVYVILGSNSNSNKNSNIDLELFNSSRGFKIVGAESGDGCGYKAGFIRDYNLDGKVDIYVSSPQSTSNGISKSGTIYVLHGLTGSVLNNSITYTKNYDLAEIEDIGIKISGSSVNEQLGRMIKAGGDLDNDGCSDIIVGSPESSYLSRNKCGRTYIVYGNKNPVDVDMSNLDQSRAMLVVGKRAIDASGTSVALSGDFNGDGYSDAIIGAPQATTGSKTKSGETYLIYGAILFQAANRRLSLQTRPQCQQKHLKKKIINLRLVQFLR